VDAVVQRCQHPSDATDLWRHLHEREPVVAPQPQVTFEGVADVGAVTDGAVLIASIATL
jgi:hypothetical protein